MRVIPALAGVLRPLVVVLGESGYPHHRVQRRRPAEDLASRPVDLAAADFLLRLGEIVPVQGAAEQLGEGGGDMDELFFVHGPGLEHHDLVTRVGAEPIGDDRSRRSGAHHDIVTLHRRSIGRSPSDQLEECHACCAEYRWGAHGHRHRRSSRRLAGAGCRRGGHLR